MRPPGTSDMELVGLLHKPGPEEAAEESAHSEEPLQQPEPASFRDQLRQLAQKYKMLIAAAVTVGFAALLVALLVPVHPRKQGGGVWKYPIDTELGNGVGPTWWEENPSASEEANAHTLLGLRLLHVFWYDQARLEFQKAIETDPSYAMPYAGLAWACKQQLWMTEDPDTARRALDDMQKQANMRQATPRERQYINAVQAMWAPNQDMETRERAYSASMKKVYQTYPDDPDACGFYGLSLLSLTANTNEYLSDTEQEDVLEEARVLLDACAKQWWDHAGILHYITHAYDDDNQPQMSVYGLDAGRHLSEVAPAACHAQHMKSHLYLHLGNWSETVDSNYRAVKASDRFCGREYASPKETYVACDKDDRYHALEWWAYGLTQQCSFSDAKALLGRMMGVYNTLGTVPFDQWALRMWSHVVMQSHAMPDVPPFVTSIPAGAALPTLQETIMTLVGIAQNESSLPTDEDIYWDVHARSSALVAGAYAVTLHANGSAIDAAVLHGKIQEAFKTLESKVNQRNDMAWLQHQLQVHDYQLRALQAVTQCVVAGNLDNTCQDWIPVMEQAVTAEDAIWGQGPTLQIVPTTEMYGHLLVLTQQNPSRATQLFDDCLKLLTNRQSCMLGQARAALIAGDGTTASSWYAKLWKEAYNAAAPADYMWPGLVEAYYMVMPAAGLTATCGVPDKYQRTPVFSYGSLTIYPIAMSENSYTPPDNFTEYSGSYPAPYCIPPDTDPVNCETAKSAGFKFKPQTVTATGSYPGGQLLLDADTGTYQYKLETTSNSQDGHWPDSSNLYSDAVRVLQEGERPRILIDGGSRVVKKLKRRWGKGSEAAKEHFMALVKLIKDRVHVTREAAVAVSEAAVNSISDSHDELKLKIRRDERKRRSRALLDR